jgi:hypothetical protein
VTPFEFGEQLGQLDAVRHAYGFYGGRNPAVQADCSTSSALNGPPFVTRSAGGCMQMRNVCVRALGGLTCALVITAAPAGAQDFGIRGGASVNPNQLYLGAHVEAGPLVDRVYFRPNVEVGFGDDLTLTTINLEFLYRHPLPRSEWGIYGGGGPAINFYNFDGGDETEAGFNLLFGLEHDRGLFTEVKAGLGDSPDLKIGVGYTWR